jgi:hypothetical protein
MASERFALREGPVTCVCSEGTLRSPPTAEVVE